MQFGFLRIGRQRLCFVKVFSSARRFSTALRITSTMFTKGKTQRFPHLYPLLTGVYRIALRAVYSLVNGGIKVTLPKASLSFL